MDRNENQETNSFVPVIARLDRLDRVLKLLEEKHNSMSSKREDYKTLSLALEEVQHKGTVIDRIALLENRVLQLSLEMDEGNTSKSSSSTVHVSETTLKDPDKQDDDDDDNCIIQLKSKGRKKKPEKRCLPMFRLRC
ncbi:hypothetical protein CASFOL_032959 [Castilleja foliolosa]|uniref:Uncharacterized protein n=1 Tax=Castilleja foliolosa TaxID=1961234 RepID=A0ABD3C2Y7_9LAMI